jgi:phenylpyruvate tautomerase PptA (4-oxalocrotonate tautomerase family)
MALSDSLGALLDLTQRVLGEDPTATAIDETNTNAEKARYISEAFAAFSQLLGNLHEESYIYVEDVRAAAYGWPDSGILLPRRFDRRRGRHPRIFSFFLA